MSEIKSMIFVDDTKRMFGIIEDYYIYDLYQEGQFKKESADDYYFFYYEDKITLEEALEADSNEVFMLIDLSNPSRGIFPASDLKEYSQLINNEKIIMPFEKRHGLLELVKKYSKV